MYIPRTALNPGAKAYGNIPTIPVPTPGAGGGAYQPAKGEFSNSHNQRSADWINNWGQNATWDDIGNLINSTQNEFEKAMLFSSIHQGYDRTLSPAGGALSPGQIRMNTMIRPWIEKNMMGGGTAGRFYDAYAEGGPMGFVIGSSKFDPDNGRFWYGGDDALRWDWNKLSMMDPNRTDEKWRDQFWLGDRSPQEVAAYLGLKSTKNGIGENVYYRDIDNWDAITNKQWDKVKLNTNYNRITNTSNPMYSGRYPDYLNKGGAQGAWQDWFNQMSEQAPGWAGKATDFNTWWGADPFATTSAGTGNPFDLKYGPAPNVSAGPATPVPKISLNQASMQKNYQQPVATNPVPTPAPATPPVTPDAPLEKAGVAPRANVSTPVNNSVLPQVTVPTPTNPTGARQIGKNKPFSFWPTMAQWK